MLQAYPCCDSTGGMVVDCSDVVCSFLGVVQTKRAIVVILDS